MAILPVCVAPWKSRSQTLHFQTLFFLSFPPLHCLPLSFTSVLSFSFCSFLFLLDKLNRFIFLTITVVFPSTHAICFHVPSLCIWSSLWCFCLSAFITWKTRIHPWRVCSHVNIAKLSSASPCRVTHSFLLFLLQHYSALQFSISPRPRTLHLLFMSYCKFENSPQSFSCIFSREGIWLMD